MSLPVIPRSLTRGRTYHWLLELTLGGRVHRLSDTGFTVTASGGDTYRFTPGLDTLSIEEALDFWASEPTITDVSFTAYMPVSIPALIKAGQPVAGATATLAIWYEGTTWEQRRKIITGTLSAVVYGAADDPLSAAIVVDTDADAGDILADVVVDYTTWPDSDDQVEGQYYPLVLGHPGSSTAISTYTGHVAGSPGLLVNDSAATGTILIAVGAVSASEVYIYDESDVSVGGYYAVTQTNDGGGTLVSVCSSTDFSALTGDELWVAWEDSSGDAQASTPNPYGSGSLRGAGDIIRYMLTRSTLDIDWSRMADLEALNAWKIDTFVNEQVAPWDWISDVLLPILPVSVARSAEGYYLVLWRWWATAADAVAHLDVDAGTAYRVTQIEYSSDARYNRIEVDYSARASDGNYYGQYILAGHVDDSDSDAYFDAQCQQSEALYGQRELVVECPQVYDPATARLVAQYMAHRYALPWRRVIIAAMASETEWLIPGSVVTVSDADAGLASQVAHVEARTYVGNMIEYTLRIF